MNTTLSDRYATNLHGVLSCYDRMIITGTLPGACYAGGMTSFLYANKIRIFDSPRFAEPLRDRVRQRAEEVCAAASVQISRYLHHVESDEMHHPELASEDLTPLLTALRAINLDA